VRLLDPKKVNCFLAAIQAGTIRGAAEKLCVEPSTISRSIAALEKQLATTLFERGGKGISLTEAGGMLRDYLRRQGSELEALHSEFDELRNMQRGNVSIAIGEGFVGDLFAQALSKFSQKYPSITYSLTVGSTEQVTHLVKSDQSHLGLAYNVAPDIQLSPIEKASQPLVLVAAPGSDYNMPNGTVPLTTAASMPCAILDRGYGVGAMLSAAEARHGFRLHAVVETGSIAVLKAFARSGMGVTFLPRFVVGSEISDGILVGNAIESPGFGHGETQLFSRNGRQLPDAAQRMAKHLARTMSAFSNKP
jgi:DNA-binding transcriptional LysR family regulator